MSWIFTLLPWQTTHAPRTGVIGGPSGWVGDCPVGEFRCSTGCLSVGVVKSPEPGGMMADHIEPEITPAADQLVEETLVEEVMIDGMCGVY